MKNSLLFSAFLIFYCSLHSQTSFTIQNVQDGEISHFSDASFYQGKYFLLSNHVEPNGAQQVSSVLHVYTDQGVHESSFPLGNPGEQYFHFHSFQGDTIMLLGSTKTDTCGSVLHISRLVLATLTLEKVSSISHCVPDKVARRMQVVKGLGDDLFIEGAVGHPVSTENGNRNFVYKVGSDFELIPVLPNLGSKLHVSVDFSRKGYLTKDAYFIDYYDTAFNKRKTRYNILDDYENEEASFSYPFNKNFILDQIFKSGGNPQGTALRVIDSNWVTRKEVVISYDDHWRILDFPQYGGVALSDDVVWTASNFGYIFGTDSSFVSITKLDTGLNILCQQFFGFDAIYRMYGISLVADDGCILYGFRRPFQTQHWKGYEDPFAIKIGDQCDLSTAAHEVGSAEIMITAFPNPTHNTITFQIDGLEAASMRVEFFDRNGTRVFTASDLRSEISVMDLPAGQYFYRILNGGKYLATGSWVKM